MKRVALVCTRGFADVLTLGRQHRGDPYALHVPPSRWLALVPQEHRFEVRGRIDAGGQEVDRLSTQGLAEAIAALPERPQAFAVSLLFAPRNPVHEEQVRALLQEAFPGVPVHCSHQVAAEGGEYERTVAVLQAAGCAMAADADPAPAQAMPGAAVQAIACRMQQVLAASSVSTEETLECAAAVFLPDGRLVAQSQGVPLLAGGLPAAVQGILGEFPPEEMQPGDGYLSNDPWRGGSHLPDLVLLRPVFAQGRVQALLACVLHHQDVGGIAPGSQPPDATSIHHEGLRIPPVLLYRGGQTYPALLRLICTNSRLPDALAGDLRAQWAALVAGDAALQPLLTDAADFSRLCEQALAAAEAATRAALRAAPDGDWRFVDALDGDGLGSEPLRLDVVLRKRGEQLVVDLTGCAPQAAGPVNAPRSAVGAALAWFARTLAPGVPASAGSVAPLQLRTAPGTLVDPGFPAAVNARANTVRVLANALLGAWAQALPQERPAPNAGAAVLLALAGSRADGTPWQLSETIASAAGGAPQGPGASGVSTDIANARSTPAESIEARAPIRVERIAVRRGSGGRGLHAGGDGVVRAYRLLEGEGTVFYRGERHVIPAQGAAGGGPGACATARIERPDGTVLQLPAKARVAWRAGDLLVIETAGAGGWGRPDGAASAAG